MRWGATEETFGRGAGSARRTLFALALLIGIAVLPTPAVASPTWLDPIPLSESGQGAMNPQIALDRDGNAIAVWWRFNGSEIAVEAAERPAGGAWGEPEELSASPGQNATYPRVAFDGEGNALVVWLRTAGVSDYVIERAEKPAGGSWGAPQGVSGTLVDVSPPQLAVNQAGDAVVVWRSFDGSHTIVEASGREAGGSWGEPVDLSAAGQYAGAPRVAIDSAGNATAIWQRSNGTNDVIQVRSRPAGDEWGETDDLSDSGRHSYESQIAVDPAGDAVAIWVSNGDTHSTVEAASRSAGDDWGPRDPLSTAGSDAYTPHVALDKDGDVVAVWARRSGINNLAEAARKPLGDEWSEAEEISASTPIAIWPQLALGPAGEAIAVFGAAGDSGNFVQAAQMSSAGAWVEPIDLSSPGGAYEPQPQVAFDPSGNAVAVWERHDGTDHIVEAGAYDAAGPLLRSLSIPAAGTVGVPLAFSVAPLDAFSALGGVAWSFGDGASAAGQNVAHTYATPGARQVTVTVTDALGNASSASRTVTLSAPAKEGSNKPARGTAVAERLVPVRKGKAQLSLRCTGAEPCAGQAKLTFAIKRKGKPGRVSVNLGAARFAIAQDKRKVLPINLNAAALKRVRGAGKAGLSARLSGPGVKARTVLLKQAARRLSSR